MNTIKTLLVLLSIILTSIVAVKGDYTQFTVSGDKCDPNKVLSINGGNCQAVCSTYGKLTTTPTAGTFNVQLFGPADTTCTSTVLGSQDFACKPNNETVTITIPMISASYDIVCLSTSSTDSSDSSSSSLVASLLVISTALLSTLLL